MAKGTILARLHAGVIAGFVFSFFVTEQAQPPHRGINSGMVVCTLTHRLPFVAL